MKVYCAADHERRELVLNHDRAILQCPLCATAVSALIVDEFLPPVYKTELMGQRLVEEMLDARPYLLVRDPYGMPEVMYERPSHDPPPEPRMPFDEALEIVKRLGG